MGTVNREGFQRREDDTINNANKKFACLDILRHAELRNSHRFLNIPLPCIHTLWAQDA